MARHKLVKRYRRRRRESDGGGGSPRRNPPLLTDLAEFVGPGFAGFAATRFATYVAATQIAKRKPTWGKHAGAGVAIGAFLAAWLLAHKVKWLEKYHTPLVVGSAIAAIQSLVQLYIPRMGWMLADPTPQMTGSQQMLTAPDGSQVSIADLTSTNDDPNDYVYNDAYDPGTVGATQQAAQQGGQPSSNQTQDQDPFADLDIEDAVGQSQNLGSLGL